MSRAKTSRAALDGEDLAGIKRKLGPKWAYRLRKTITPDSLSEDLGQAQPDPFC